MRCQVDIYVVVPGDTSNVAVEGTIAEGMDHGVVFLLGDLTTQSRACYIVKDAKVIQSGEVPKQILDEWDEAEDLALEPENP